MVIGRSDRVEIEQALRDEGALTASEVHEKEGLRSPSSSGDTWIESEIDDIRLTRSALTRAKESANLSPADMQRLLRWVVERLDMDMDVDMDPRYFHPAEKQQEIFIRERDDLRTWCQRELVDAGNT